MTTVQVVLGATAVITTSANPVLGMVNRYNANTGNLAPVLPLLSGLNVGANTVIEKDTLDNTAHLVTATCAGSDTFDDGTTTEVLESAADNVTLQVVSILGVKYWKVMQRSGITTSSVGTLTGDLNFGGHKGTNAANASADSDLPNYGQVLTLFNGKVDKGTVNYASTGSETYTISAGHVTQISGTSFGGGSPAVTDRLLIKNAPASSGAGTADSNATGTNQAPNGFYSVVSNTTNLTVARTTDADASAEVLGGSTVWVNKGTLADTQWTLISDDPITLNTTTLQFTQTDRSALTFSGGVTKTGNAVTREALTGDVTASAGSNATTIATGVTITSPNLVTPALGTPASGTLTNCTGLPVAGITASTSTALGVGSLEVGAATDTTISRVSAGKIAVEGVNVVTISSTDTLTNKTLTSPTLTTPVLGTPSSGTLTSCTGLPIAGLTASTSTALGVGSVELGHATDTTLTRSAAGTLAVEGVDVVTLSASQTLTNKTLTSPTLTTPALGTPASGTLTNCTALPVAGITASTVTAIGVGSVELGHATDTTLSRLSAGKLAVEGVEVDTISSATTLTNKTLTSPTLTTPVLGTPSSGTLTNCTALPVAGITASTVTALGVGSIELGHASDTTLSRSAAGVLAVEGVDQVNLSASQTLTNKTLTSPTLTTPALGTPASGTLTNCTGLPVAGITASTSTALGVGSIELGAASDTTLSRSAAGVLAVEGADVPTISSTSTLTNKRVNPRVTTSNAPGATPTVATDSNDLINYTGLAAAITSMTTNLTGTPVDGQKLMLTFKDSGTARAITWGTSFQSSGVATLLATTVISKKHYVGLMYDGAASKWTCIAVDATGY